MDEPLDVEAVSRVLRRAHEIEAAHTVADEMGVGVSPQALIEAAGEVGIDPDSVRDALALERFDAGRPPPARLDRVAGPSSIVIEHVVHRAADEALASAEAWLTVSHRMSCVRNRDGSIEARPRSGWAASLARRTVRLAGEASIAAVDRVRVEAQPLATGSTPEHPRTLVRIIADRQGQRSRRLGGGSAAGAAGLGTAALGVAEGLALWPALAVPLVGGGYVLARSAKSRADRIELELMRVLTAVDRGEQPVGLVGRAARRARRAVAEVRQRN